MLAFPTRHKTSCCGFAAIPGTCRLSLNYVGIKHLRPVIAPVADGRVSRFHNHLVRVVGMEKVERRARVASLVVDAEPAVIVARVQDEGKTVVDLRDEFVGFGGNQGEGLEVGSVRPLPGVPDAGEGERAGLGQGDVEDALDGLGCLCFLRRFRRRTKEISRDSERFRAVGGSTGFFSV